MYEQKADIVFQIAGGTGVGVFEAAQEQGHYAIGVDSDQATIIADTDPDQAQHILTSMMKNVDFSLYRAVDMYLNGELPLGEIEVALVSPKAAWVWPTTISITTTRRRTSWI